MSKHRIFKKPRDLVFNIIGLTVSTLAFLAVGGWLIATHAGTSTAVSYGPTEPVASASASPARPHVVTATPGQSRSQSQSGTQSPANKINSAPGGQDTGSTPARAQKSSQSQHGIPDNMSEYEVLVSYCAAHPENAKKCAPIFRRNCVGLAMYNDQPESVKDTRRARGEFADQYECEAYFDRQIG